MSSAPPAALLPQARRASVRWPWGLTLLALLAAGVLGLWLAVTERTQPLPAPGVPTARDLLIARTLSRPVARVIRNGEGSAGITLSNDVLASLDRLVHNAVPDVVLATRIEDQALVARGSLRVGELPFRPYVWFTARAPLVPDQPLWPQVSIGPIPLPDALTRAIANRLGERYLGAPVDTLVRVALVTEAPAVVLNVTATPAMRARVMGVRAELGGPVTPDMFAAYCGALRAHRKVSAVQDQRLEASVRQLFRVAQQRVAAPRADVQLEAQAAWMVLAQVNGPGAARVLGQSGDGCGPGSFAGLLAGRLDLARHLTLSVALTYLADSHTARAIGEFKELDDSRRGGSGFSFADIAADRAGVRLAHAAMADAASARVLIDKLANVDALLPPALIRDLPEGLSEEAFAGQYRDIASPAYRDLVARIDTALETLPIYAGTPRPPLTDTK
jgi:uncharacterized protein YfiM (DUF2279 family)